MSEQSNDGGPAFPVADNTSFYTSSGMSLRDWFAGQALAGWASSDSIATDDPFGVHANACYRFADAMINARNR